MGMQATTPTNRKAITFLSPLTRFGLHSARFGWHGGLVLLATSLIQISAFATGTAASNSCGKVLPGQICRSVPGGDAATYGLYLRAGEFLRIQADQFGTDIVLKLLDSSGSSLVEIDSPTGDFGSDTLYWLAVKPGLIRVEVASPDPSAKLGHVRLSFHRSAQRSDSDELVKGQAAYLRGLTYSARRQRKEALTAYQEALKAFTGTAEKKQLARVLRLYAAALSGDNQVAQALASGKYALGWAQQAHDYHEEQIIRSGIGRDLKLLGRYAEAIRAYKEAVALGGKTKDEALLANLNHDIGAVHIAAGHYKQAATYLQRALTVYEREQRESAIAVTLTDLGTVANFLSHYDEARSNCSRSLDTGRLTLPAFLCVGTAYRGLNRYDEALASYKRASEWAAKSGDRRGEAVTLSESGQTYWLLGQFERARADHDHALRLARTINDRRTEAAALYALAQCYRVLNRFVEAVSNYEQALTLARSLGNRSIEADILSGLGQALLNLGRPQDGLRHFESAAAHYRHLGIRVGEATQLRNISSARIALRDFQGAADAALLGFAAALEVGDERNQGLTLGLLMTACRQLGEPRLAVYFGKQAVNSLQSVRVRNRRLGEEALEAFATANGSIYRDLADLLVSLGRLDEARQVMNMLKREEYDQLLRADIGTKSSGIAIGEDEEGFDNEFAKVRQRLVGLGKQRRVLLSKPDGAQEAELTKIESLIMLGNRGFQRTLRQLAVGSSNRPEMAVKLRQAEDLRGIMKELRELPAPAVMVYTIVSEDRYVSILYTSEVQKSYEYRITASELSAKVQQFRQSVQDTRQNPRTVAEELFKILIGPEMDQDLRQSGARMLILALDGVLRYAPIAALHDGHQYLAERFGLTLLTPATIARLRDGIRPELKVVGFGVSGSVGGFPALPHVRVELDKIVRVQGSNEGIVPGEKLADGAFNMESFRRTMRSRWPIVHIASHFRFVPGDSRQSALLLGDGSLLSIGQLRQLPNPFEDTELLTLSACETGLGGSRFDGAEVEAFGVIAQQQGASSVIATLWSVNDASTSLLMEYFYKIWTSDRSLSKSEALRLAQVALLTNSEPTMQTKTTRGFEDLKVDRPGPKDEEQRSYSHPFYWAPFFVMGNWR